MDVIKNEPVIFTQGKSLDEFLKKGRPRQVIDAYPRQLKELYFIENPSFIGSDKEAVYASDHYKEYCASKNNSLRHVYFPWSGILVNCVNEEDYFRLITNRNHDLVTSDEQSTLYSKKIAIFGMSVGSNIAYTLVQSGISNEIYLADYDELDTTNLNRLPGGVHQIGVNKTIVAARRIYENNPYVTVNKFDKGISLEELEPLLHHKKIDLIFEEIDNISLKIEIRKLAKKYKVPVLMVTDNGDGVVLHIERYDLSYNDFFGKTEKYWDEKMENIQGPADIGALILNDIIGGEQNLHDRVADSVSKVLKRELISWSQLGTAAILGGVVSTIAVKKIFLWNDKRDYVHEAINLKI